ncbi:hypothetical protein BEWA_012240 [Theileria equi strain WA]|uniref:Uncharacterized protein n=1 Tax=Theileria equi strain WA TaxID=1537102 RepID=L1LBL8_THEEQ|nr:hypothetical protein BEWA_012240 [Theileria equi strain WA]EKX72665.1 hypothetical protein BEWA_012240 [Theileria equi strain WA]|eukprot:XP_004832117.1 hypothetical protein BEWA_012240 [Theileria equi strain WA]
MDKWISQSHAIIQYGLAIEDLNSNIAKVIDLRPQSSQQGKRDSNVKISKDPKVPLTLRLLPNPRGYRHPMHLYKIRELEELANVVKSRKIAQEQPKSKKVVKKQKKKITSATPVNVCDVVGHKFEIFENFQECSICGTRVEVMKI